MENVEWIIDTLNLQLPSGFAHRADAIARQVGRELARLPVHHNLNLATLDLPGLSLQGGETDGVIARRIAQSIYTSVRSMPQRDGASAGHASER